MHQYNLVVGRAVPDLRYETVGLLKERSRHCLMKTPGTLWFIPAYKN